MVELNETVYESFVLSEYVSSRERLNEPAYWGHLARAFTTCIHKLTK